jgi:cytochrome c
MPTKRSADGPPRLTLSLFFQMTALFAILSIISAADLAIRGLRRYPLPVQSPVWSIPGGDSDRGAVAIVRYGCAGCHTIPGIRTATGRVGPDLAGLRNRTFLAGRAPNTPDKLVSWIQNPQQIDPETAMPNLGVTDAEARDIVVYLYAEQ